MKSTEGKVVSADTSGTNTGKIEIYNSNAANQAAALLSTADSATVL